MQIVVPDSYNPPAEYSKMAHAYIDGINLMMPCKFWSVQAVLAVVYWSFGKPSGYCDLSLTDKARFWCTRLLCLTIRWAPGFERIASFLLLLVIKLLPEMSANICPKTGAVANGKIKCPGSTKSDQATYDLAAADTTAFVLGVKSLACVLILLQIFYLVCLCGVLGVGLSWLPHVAWSIGVAAVEAMPHIYGFFEHCTY